MGNLYTFISQPGVRRDGTELDSPFYADGVWVRWQRGKPRKIGGYRVSSQAANGPVRGVVVDSRNGVTSAHYFSPWGIQRQQLTAGGAGAALEERAPANFAYNPLLTWTSGFMYSATGGQYTALLAASAPDIEDITSDVGGRIYTGNATTSDVMTEVSNGSGPISVSGGITVLQPFLFAYGSNGLIRNSNPNDFSTATGWVAGGGNFANQANVAGTKVVYGAPTRGGGQSPAGLFWALDALIRVSFVGGTAIWNYDTLSSPTTILSKKAIVEHDGKFFWPGVDRFLMYAGAVQEVPNDMNQNWFFDNLNFAARNKVWGTKIQRFGEIWWFYPRGSATECTDAVIFNYREGTWYDAVLRRSAGDKVQTFKYPIWVGSEDGFSTTKLSTGVRGNNSADTLAGLVAPVQSALVASTSGGTGLQPATLYYYVITALNALGETLRSNEQSVLTGAGTTNSNALSWSTVAGATGYKVYRGISGASENGYYALGNVTAYTDTGAAITTGTPPANNTTSNTLTFTAVPAISIGMGVTGHPGLLPNTTVTAFTATTVTISSAPTALIPAGTQLTFSSMVGVFKPGDVVTGVTSAASGTVVRTNYTEVNVNKVAGVFLASETVSAGSVTAVVQATPQLQQLDAVYQHEFGYDKVVNQDVTAILSSFTSQNFGFASGAPFGDAPMTKDIGTRITRLEPDWNQVGDVTVRIEGRGFAQKPNKVLNSYVMAKDLAFQDMREQARILRVTLESNSLGGYYEQGQVLIGLEPGDERSDQDI